MFASKTPVLDAHLSCSLDSRVLILFADDELFAALPSEYHRESYKPDHFLHRNLK